MTIEQSHSIGPCATMPRSASAEVEARPAVQAVVQRGERAESARKRTTRGPIGRLLHWWCYRFHPCGYPLARGVECPQCQRIQPHQLHGDPTRIRRTQEARA